eukprot:GFUD01009814.1.p1 GENE.GFUD01009814.1~~GFUD01009814.1.p1  ORF type:complete len:341 (-),score=50.10 GFUD01009814.1:1558-2580(-)
MRMGDNTNNNTQSIADYLAQLLKDKKQLAAFPNVFVHMERLLDDEISKVRSNLFQINGYVKEPLILPEGSGPPVIHSEKVYVPVKEHPDFNFVGRILGPRGMTTKQLEQETGCKIMVRGRGSMRDKKKEEQNRGKPNWEHLNDELHVLITVEDSENRAKLKLERAVDEVKKLLTVSEGEDELKKRQLMELAIINGTYRDSSSKNSSQKNAFLIDNSAFSTEPQLQKLFYAGLDSGPRLQLANQTLQNALASQAAVLRQGNLGGPPLILSPRLQGLQVPTTMANGLLNGGPPPLINPADTQGLLYAQYGIADYSNYASLTSPLLADYQAHADAAGLLLVGM